MEVFIKLVMVAFTAVILENSILTRSIGTSTLICATKNKKTLFEFSFFVTYICTAASIISYFVNKYIPNTDLGEAIRPFIYIIIISVIYVVTLLIISKFSSWLYKRSKNFLHLCAFNGAVLGALFLNQIQNNSLIEYIIFGFSTGIGFFIASYLALVAKDKLDSEKIPPIFRGFPSTMIYLGIISMVLFAFTGHTPQI